MWNGSVSIPVGKHTVTNANGFDTDQWEFLGGVPANFTDATRDDLILANQKGYTVDQNIEIAVCNYHGEGFLVDESTGSVYDIKRTFQKDKSMMIQLSCERRPDGHI